MQKKPCKECPFRRDSWPGYLGDSSNPEAFLATMEHSPIPCHLRVNWELDSKEEIAEAALTKTCIGSVQFKKNSCNIPRDRNYAKMVAVVEKNPEVFQWRKEFIEHHS